MIGTKTEFPFASSINAIDRSACASFINGPLRQAFGLVPDAKLNFTATVLPALNVEDSAVFQLLSVPVNVLFTGGLNPQNVPISCPGNVLICRAFTRKILQRRGFDPPLVRSLGR